LTEALELRKSPAAGRNDLEMTLAAGEHALYVKGDLRTGREWFDIAYREAERCGDEHGMARAALGLGGLWVHEHRTAADGEMVRARQRTALSMIDPRSSPAFRLRLRLTAEEDYRTGGHAAIFALLTEARRAGDAVALAEALSLAHNCVLGPEHGALRLELAEELIGEASRTGRRSDLLMGLLWQTADLFWTADPHAHRRLEELRALLAQGDHLAVGFELSAIEVMLTIRAGRFAEAEALAAACADRGATAGDIDATGYHAGQLAAIRWYQGRIAELVPVLSELVNSPTLSTVDYSILAGLAVAAASSGDRRLAAGALARLRGGDLAELPHSSSWLTSMYGVVEAAHLLADADTSRQAYALLAPFDQLPVITSLGVACLGSVHHSLGVASLTTGDLDRAVEHLRTAVHDNLALGHWPAVILSRSRLGQALALREEPQDKAARRELEPAAREAAALGMTLPAAHSPAEPVERGGRVVCRRSGRRWRIEMDGRTAVVGHSVGMRHLATLLGNPGREIPAVELVAGPGLPGRAAPRESAQPVLDEVATREYRRRLADLEAEIDELEAMNDLGRAARARAERDWLIAELTATTGIGGRTRRFSDTNERARIAVGKAIRRAIARISAADPVIGDELRAAINTGQHCSYQPELPGSRPVESKMPGGPERGGAGQVTKAAYRPL
jgi:hypothetical protein